MSKLSPIVENVCISVAVPLVSDGSAISAADNIGVDTSSVIEGVGGIESVVCAVA